MAHCRPASSSGLQIVASLAPETREVEPSALLGILPAGLSELSDQLYVHICDDTQSVTYRYGLFMAKTYALRSGKIHFGSVKMDLNGLSIIIGIRRFCIDIDSLTEPLD